MTVLSVHSEATRVTSAQAAAIKAELEAILKSPHFAGSKRCHDLLEYVVNSALNGDLESLTERFIGARVFGRPIDYETATDAIVRVRANDVRRRLTQFYTEQNRTPAVRIGLHSGSYIPEFEFSAPVAGHPAIPVEIAPESAVDGPLSTDPHQVGGRPARPGFMNPGLFKLAAPIALGLALVTAIVVARVAFHDPPVDQFWAPLVHEKSDILICAGGNTFLQNPVPGFFTAGKEIDYPYFSLQTEVATTLLSTMIERRGATPQFRFAASTPLPEFHEHPIILLNAYNNQWTLRLTNPLRFHFNPAGSLPQSIVDRQHAEIGWHRDPALPYENSDDYALLARFWDSTTDNWVVVLAGLGRNGTEAATRFAVDPHYMQELCDRMGGDFSNRNIEVVIRAKVVDGKTGVPEMVAVHSW